MTLDGRAAAGAAASSMSARSSMYGRWSAYQKRVLILVSLTIVLDGFDTQTLSLAIPHSSAMGSQPRAVRRGADVGLCGDGAGNVLGGLLGDRLGRRFALLASMIVFGARIAFLITLRDNLKSRAIALIDLPSACSPDPYHRLHYQHPDPARLVTTKASAPKPSRCGVPL